MAKILFLDMDGVILSGRELRRTKNNSYVPPGAVALLNQVVERTGCQVVMSSTWRYLKPDVRGLLRDAGFTGEFHEDWKTPDNGAVGVIWAADRRGGEIADWLSRNPVDAYAIIDDDSDMLPEQRPFFVKTKYETGIWPEHVERLVAILGGHATP